jgi:diadenosine tetraphosphatase ApaH/serine/threonine PP2A family protein phosphatase
MKMAILGDIHSNHEALEAVLADVRHRGVDTILHVGDVVGYCTDFENCISRLKSENIQGVHGNHDLMVLGLLATDRCVSSGREAVVWTQSRMTEETRSYLAGLPGILEQDKVIVFHASPDSVERGISTEADARRAFSRLEARGKHWFVAFHGHTHKQRVFEKRGDDVRLAHAGEGQVELDVGARYLVSAGSVGQSRDYDPRTGYLIYDTQGRIELVRLAYNWRACRRKIRNAGLSTALYRSYGRFPPILIRGLMSIARAVREVV